MADPKPLPPDASPDLDEPAPTPHTPGLSPTPSDPAGESGKPGGTAGTIPDVVKSDPSQQPS